MGTDKQTAAGIHCRQVCSGEISFAEITSPGLRPVELSARERNLPEIAIFQTRQPKIRLQRLGRAGEYTVFQLAAMQTQRRQRHINKRTVRQPCMVEIGLVKVTVHESGVNPSAVAEIQPGEG